MMLPVLISSLGFVVISAIFGMYLSRGVHTIKGFTVAGRSLPVYISTATLFATWFGAESILGIPESFMEHGVIGVMSDPLGAFLCLIIIGIFFAKRLYNLNITTIADLFYNRFGKKVEIIMGLAISCSYLGWIAAQLLAFGMVLHFMLGKEIGIDIGIVLGGLIVVIYTFKGGMLSVAINDFIQTCIITSALLFMVVKVSFMAGGFWAVIEFAEKFKISDFRYDEYYPNMGAVIGVILSMILGTIPQQDTFQRITSSRNANEARLSTILGGFAYIFITMMPIFIVLGAAKLEVEATGKLPDEFDVYIAHFVTEHTPFFVQVLFFGALFAAILSTASGTILASSVVFASNVVGAFFPAERNLNIMRLTLIFTTLTVIIIAIFSDSSIHRLVENSGKITMVVAFCPLMCALYWSEASHRGIILATICSLSSWGLAYFYQELHQVDLKIPPEICGLIASALSSYGFSVLFPDHQQFKRALSLHKRHLGS